MEQSRRSLVIKMENKVLAHFQHANDKRKSSCSLVILGNENFSSLRENLDFFLQFFKCVFRNGILRHPELKGFGRLRENLYRKNWLNLVDP